MAASLQQPPLYNSYISTTATSLQQPPLYNSHISTTATSQQQPPPYNGCLSTIATSLQQPPLYNSHLSTTATSLQWLPLYNGHLSSTATSLQGYLSTTAIFLYRESIHSLLFQPRYNSHFLLSPSWQLWRGTVVEKEQEDRSQKLCWTFQTTSNVATIQYFLWYREFVCEW